MSDQSRYAESLPTAFARHKLPSNVLPYLWEDHRIAIHWKDLASADSDDYENSRAASEIGNLNSFAEDGAIFGASFRKITKNKMLIGIVEPGSEVDLLIFEGDDLAETVSIEPGTSIDVSYDLDDDEIWVYKSLQLTEGKVITRQDNSLLFDDSVRPPFWSICGWDGAEDQLRALIRGELQPYSAGSLTPDQLEVVCEEYLRIVSDDYHRVAGIGGTTSDIDIMGGTSNRLLWAQVTHGKSGKVKNKIDKLGDYTEEEARVIIFAPASSKPDELPDEITYIPIESVFDTVDLNARGEAMLQRMLGRRE